MSDQPTFLKRNTICGALDASWAGREVILNGWVNRRRDHGGLIFLDLRDRSGLVQVVLDPSHAPAAHEQAGEVRGEYVLAIRGTVRPRPEGTENAEMPTGEIEVLADELHVLNPSETPPFSHQDRTETDEYIRLKYRYLDLRSPRMQANLELRHVAAQAAREFLNGEGFWEVETPFLFKPTPEGARDYLVPSRVSPGNFYALPQSPQTLKQLLMVGGIEKYYQIARCMRDEDLRADRQPEFTQIDLEMSFVEQDDVLEVTERLISHIFQATLGVELDLPFERLTHAEALRRFGTDKPDMRFAMELVDLTEAMSHSEFKVFSRTVESGGQIKGICAQECGSYSRSQLDHLTDFAKQHKAQGLVWMQVQEDGAINSPVAKFLSEAEIAAILDLMKARPGDLLLIVADQPAIVAESLDWLRRELAGRMGLLQQGAWKPLWVVEFPMFSWNAEENRWDAEHHPFCMPNMEDMALLETDPGRVRAQSYDLVLNGVELASGSVRIHLRDVQAKIFDLLAISPEKAEAKFGFLLKAFEFGAPPHAGIAPGFDRLVAMLCGEENIREVIAFPKTQRAQDLMSGAPAEADPQSLRDLYLKLDLPPEG
ncbi:MAG TPA: aspartate--tRNA ligase [Armatimonadota bacterium]|jgi:aspartyl-tRNA synthetase